MKTFKINTENIASTQANINSSGLVLQAYCNSVLQQPNLNFSSVEELIDLQEDINKSLADTKVHANVYLNDISLRIIKSLSDLKSYFNVYSSVPATLPEGSTVAQWVAVLTVIKSLTENNLQNSEAIVKALNELRDNLRSDATNFATLSQKANDELEGDEGELAAIRDSLKEIDTAIKLIITSLVGESIAIVGGAIAIGIGVSAGSTEVIVGGVIAVGVGTVGLAASSIELANLYDEKGDLMGEQSKLEDQVKLLSSVDSALDNIADQTETAALATQDILSTWEELSTNLDSLIDDLNNGIISTDELRTFFLNSANNEIAALQNTISIIQEKLAGVITITVPQDTSVVRYLRKVS